MIAKKGAKESANNQHINVHDNSNSNNNNNKNNNNKNNKNNSGNKNNPKNTQQMNALENRIYTCPISFEIEIIESVPSKLIREMRRVHELICRLWEEKRKEFIKLYMACSPERFLYCLDVQMKKTLESKEALNLSNYVNVQHLSDNYLSDIFAFSNDLHNGFENYEKHKTLMLDMIYAIVFDDWWQFDSELNKSIYPSTSLVNQFKVIRRYLITILLKMFIEEICLRKETNGTIYTAVSNCSFLDFVKQASRERNRFDLTTDIAYNHVLREYRRDCMPNESSLYSLYLAFFYNPTVVYHLLDYTSKPCKYSISDQEAYAYAQRMKSEWRKTRGAINWLRKWLNTPCNLYDCSYHTGCIEYADELKKIGNEKFISNEFFDAIEFYTRALAVISSDLHPEKITYYSNRALCFAKLNDHDCVIEDCTSTLRMSNTHIKALCRRALSYEAIGKNNLALNDLETLLSLDPSNKLGKEAMARISSKLTKAQEQVMAHQKLKDQGNVKYKQSEFAEALKLYAKAISVCPFDSMDLAVLYCNRAACYLQLGDNRNCIDDCTSSIAIDPCYFRARLRRAISYEKEKLLIHALNDLNIAKKMDQNNPEILSTLQRVSKRVDEINDEVQTLYMRHSRPRNRPSLMTYQLDIIAESMSRTYVMRSRMKLPRLNKFWELLNENQKEEICNLPRESTLLRMDEMSNFIEIALLEAAVLIESPYFIKCLRISFENALESDGVARLPPDIHFGPWIDSSIKANCVIRHPCSSFEYDKDLNKENRLASGFLRVLNNGRDIRYHCRQCDKYKPWYCFYRASIKRAEHICSFCKMNIPGELASLGLLDDAKHKYSLKNIKNMEKIQKDSTLVEDIAYQNTYVIFTTCLDIVLERLEKAFINPPKNVDTAQMKSLISKHYSNNRKKKEKPLPLVTPPAPIKDTEVMDPLQQHMKSMLEDMQLSLFSVMKDKGSGFASAIEGMKPEQTNGACAFCYKSEADAGKLKRCSNCKCIFYCSIECQRKHWTEHKSNCYPLPKFELLLEQLNGSTSSRETIISILDALVTLAEKNSYYRRVMADQKVTDKVTVALGMYKDDEEVKRLVGKLLFYLAHTKRGKQSLKSHVHFIMGIASRWLEEKASLSQSDSDDIPLSSMILQTALAVVSDEKLVVE